MDNLRNFIDRHRKEFDTGPMPEGHKERFLARLQQGSGPAPPHRVFPRPWRLAAVVAAAVLVAGVFLLRRTGPQDPVAYEITSYNRTLAAMTDDIRDICRRKGLDTLQVDQVIGNIEGEAIPLYEQLPDELPEKQKASILRRYFDLKLDAVKQLRASISHEESNH